MYGELLDLAIELSRTTNFLVTLTYLPGIDWIEIIIEHTKGVQKGIEEEEAFFLIREVTKEEIEKWMRDTIHTMEKKE